MPGERRFPGWVRHSGIGLELAGATAGLALIGYWIDGRFGTRPWGIVGGVVIGLVGGLYNMVRESLNAVREAGTEDKAANDAAAGSQERSGNGDVDPDRNDGRHARIRESGAGCRRDQSRREKRSIQPRVHAVRNDLGRAAVQRQYSSVDHGEAIHRNSEISPDDPLFSSREHRLGRLESHVYRDDRPIQHIGDVRAGTHV